MSARALALAIAGHNHLPSPGVLIAAAAVLAAFWWFLRYVSARDAWKESPRHPRPGVPVRLSTRRSKGSRAPYIPARWQGPALMMGLAAAIGGLTVLIYTACLFLLDTFRSGS